MTATSNSFTLTATGLSEGSHSFSVRATDAAGNTGSPAILNSITVDTTPPAAPSITSPADGSFTKDEPVTISGSTDAGTTVKVTIDTGTPVDATVSGTSFSYSAASLAEGQHVITAQSTDTAGNSASSSAIRFTVYVVQPIITSINPVNGQQQVSPTASVTATFSHKMDPNTINTSTFHINGGWPATISVSSDGLSATLT